MVKLIDEDDIRGPLIMDKQYKDSNHSTDDGNSTAGSANKIRNTKTNIQNPNDRPSAALMKLKTYLTALRPWSLSASLVPTLLGSAIAYRSPGQYEFNLFTFILTLFTVITVHCAGNVVNTYFDYIKGIDNRKSDDRTLVDHILSKDEVRQIIISFIIPLMQFYSMYYVNYFKL